MKRCIIFVFILIILLTGCGKPRNTGQSTTTDGAATAVSENKDASTAEYEQITQDKAKELIDAEEPVIILDVRTYEEYEEGHIQGSLCIPVDTINEKSRAQIEMMFPNKEQTILVYCRSGNRSKTASQKLADMGYVDVKEFGGINDWQYGTVTE